MVARVLSSTAPHHPTPIRESNIRKQVEVAPTRFVFYLKRTAHRRPKVVVFLDLKGTLNLVYHGFRRKGISEGFINLHEPCTHISVVAKGCTVNYQFHS